MKYLVLSDTHGRLGPAEQIIKSLSDIDGILHLGDYQRDGEQLKAKTGLPVVSLKGNMDGSFDPDGYVILKTEFGELYLSHGHMESVKFGPENLLYKASALGCKAALFGHTHVPLFQEIQGMYLLNPGSLTNPRGGRRGSYAVLTVEKETFSATIFYVEEGPAAGLPQKRGEAAGFLRGRFNDSDGQ